MRSFTLVGTWSWVIVGALSAGLVVADAHGAETANAKGKLVVNKVAIPLKYAYVYAHPADDDKTKETLEIMAANIPLSDKAVEDWSERSRMESEGKLKCVQWTIEPSSGQSVKIYDSTFKASPGGFSTDFVLDFKTRDNAKVAGRMYSKTEQEFFGTRYTFDVTFSAPVHRKAKPAPATKAEQAEAAKSPQADVYTKFIKAVHAGDVKTLKTLMPAANAKQFDGPDAKELVPWLQGIFPPTAEFQRVTREGNTTTLLAKAPHKGQERFGTIQLVMEDGSWKVTPASRWE